jgi:diguanylate cyclase (GGDEF)-like protein/PAS domain S-box-containing protein
MTFDIRTLAFVLGMTHIIQVVVFAQQYRINKTIPGVGWWLMWSSVEVIGFSFMLLRGIPSIESVAILGQNTLIILGVLFLYVGLMRFLGKKENHWMVISIFVVFIVPFLYFLWVDNNIEIRGILIAAALAEVSFLSAQRLWVNKTPAISTSANFTITIFMLHGCYFTFRAAKMLTGTSIDKFDVPTLFNVSGYLDGLIVGILLTIGLILMINQRLNAEVNEVKEHLELIFNTSPDAALIFRLKDGVIVNINDGFTLLTGFTREETTGQPSLNLNIWKNPDERQRVVDELSQKGVCENFEGRFRRKDGSQIFGILSAKIINLKGVPHVVSFTRDINDRKRAEEALRESEARYRAVTHSANDAIITADGAGNIVSWNRGAEKMFGYTIFEISGQPVTRLMSARYSEQHLAGMGRLRAGEEPQVIGKTVELEGRHKDGSEFPIELSLAQWETDDGRFYTAILRDVTERKHYQDYLEYFAAHDQLTGLLNRHSLEDLLNRTNAKAKRGTKSSLLYMDLDNLKDVNDTVGHSAGDEVLITLTNLIKTELRTEDLVFRLGGDEFAVLLDGMESREALSAAERLRLTVAAHPFEESGRIFSLSLSIGLIQIDGTLSPNQLLSQADNAMYRAKAQGKNRVVVYR